MTVDLGPLLAAVRDEWETGKSIAQRAGINPRTAGPRLTALVREQLAERRHTGAHGGVHLYRRGRLAPPLAEQQTVPADRSTAGLVADAVKAFEVAYALASIVAVRVEGDGHRLARAAAASARRSAGRLELIDTGAAGG